MRNLIRKIYYLYTFSFPDLHIIQFINQKKYKTNDTYSSSLRSFLHIIYMPVCLDYN